MPALLSALALTLTATACGEADSEPDVDYDAFAESVAALPAVESVDADADGETFVAEISAVADEAALRTTGRRIMRLLDDTGGSPDSSLLTIVSGPYTVASSYGYSDPDGGAYRSSRLDLTALPDLRALPDVDAGTLRNGTATVTLEEGSDLRTWVEDAVTRDGDAQIRAHPAAKDADGTGDAAGGGPDTGDAGSAGVPAGGSAETDYVPGPTPTDELEESFSFHLGTETGAEAVQRLHRTGDAADAEVVTAQVYRDGEVDADLSFASVADLAQLDDVFADEYDALTGFTFHTGDGFRLDYGTVASGHSGQDAPAIDDVLGAHEQIEDLGASMTSVSEELQETEIAAPDASTLRDVAEALSSSSWPLEPTQRVSLSHPDSRDVASLLPAEAWDERADVIASLWHAGFTSVADRGVSAPALTIEDDQGPDVTTTAGRDALIAALRSADWQGTARITLERPPTLTFESTADGKALNPHYAQHDASTELSEWGQEVIDAWNATAG